MTRPAAVGAWVLAGLGITLVSTDPVTRIIVLVAAWVLLARRTVEGRRLRPLVLGLVVIGVVTILVNGILDHTGATLLVVLPSWIPLVGGPISAESFAAGAGIALGLVSAISVTASLSLVVEPSDLIDAFPHALQRTAATLGSALNLVPATAISFTEVRDAQRLRGWRAKGPRAMADLAVPVLLGAIERSVQLAESMEARAFGGGPRVSATERERTSRGGAIGVGALIALAALIVARVTGQSGTWLPYPTPSVPSVTFFAVAPALLLLGLAFLVSPSPD